MGTKISNPTRRELLEALRDTRPTAAGSGPTASFRTKGVTSLRNI
jgi:hypothetical protein